jgi:hypothetical protein
MKYREIGIWDGRLIKSQVIAYIIGMVRALSYHM